MTEAGLEAHEHAHHAVHEHDPFVSRAAVTVAILAVLAAGSGGLETVEGSKALVASSAATLAQDKATDAWGEFEADSLKRHLYTVAAELNGGKADAYRGTAKEESDKQARIRTQAAAFEAERDRFVSESGVHEERHHWLTGAAIAFEIAIALSTVAIISRRRWVWAGSLVLGAAGVALLAFPYLA